jgi:hypothetical protein
MSVEISEKVRCTNCGKYQFEHSNAEIAEGCDKLLIATVAVTSELERLARLQAGMMRGRLLALSRRIEFPVRRLRGWGALHRRRHRG